MKLFGRPITKAELIKYVGDISQIGGAVRCTLREGRAEGIDAVSLRTGTGFSFVVLPSRCLDISFAEYCGTALCWRSPVGDLAPSYYDAEGFGWLRSFNGGLVTTCGLMTAGWPSNDAGERLGLHGRIANSPADHVTVSSTWRGDDYVLQVQGRVRDTSAFGPTLELRRCVETVLGESKLIIADTVENVGTITAPHMYRYHVNAGFPLLAPGSRITARVDGIQPRDPSSAGGIGAWDTFGPPISQAKEEVFYLDLRPEADGTVKVEFVNPNIGGGRLLGLSLKYPKSTLPRFLLWKRLAEGTYVVGLEPSNCYDEGRAAERSRGTLMELEPGESVAYFLEIDVITSPSKPECAGA